VVAPGIAEVESRAWRHLDARSFERGAHRRLVVDDEAELAAVV
jgi:hypothetical protein